MQIFTINFAGKSDMSAQDDSKLFFLGLLYLYEPNATPLKKSTCLIIVVKSYRQKTTPLLQLYHLDLAGLSPGDERGDIQKP